MNAVHKNPFSSQGNNNQTDSKSKTGVRPVSGVALHNLWQTSTAMSDLHVVTAKNQATVCFTKKNECGNSITHQATAAPTPGATPREVEEDTDFPITVCMISVESS